MYWLLSALIIMVMMAVLAVTTSDVLSVISLPVAFSTIALWPYLVAVALSLIILSQRSIFLRALGTNKSFAKPSAVFFSVVATAFYYLLMTMLAMSLVIGSALQALSQQQQAEKSKITQSLRVQALVTIDGISDSVYDTTSNSSYRQVATISHIAPLVTELSAKDLDALTVEQLQANHITDNSDTQATSYQVLLSAYPKIKPNKNNLASLNNLQPGDQLVMSLTLAPLKDAQEAITNPTGFDSYRWLRARHIDGVANILSVGTPIANTVNSPDDASNIDNSPTALKRLRTHIDQGRWQLRQSFYQHWPSLTLEQQQADAVTLSLLTGDRSLINRETKDLYQLAGISHLLAISGTHVLFLAIVLAGLAVLIVDRFWPTCYSFIARWQVRWGVMISAAFIYALFTGFDVPAARTAWTLLAIGAVRLTLLPISTMRVLLALAVLMAWVDPYVLWQAGYWLSFIAVALILKYDNSLHHPISSTNDKAHSSSNQKLVVQHNSIIDSSFITLWPTFKRLFKLQCWLFIALLPITLLLFGKASLWGLVINLFAIGLFGWIIVPLNLLAGLCYLVLPSIATMIWALVSGLVANLHQLITWLTGIPALNEAWLYTPVNTAIVLIVLLVLLPWLLPRGLLSRGLSLPPLSLLLITLYANQQTLSLTPTLYVLPTSDKYVTAAVLQYPVNAIKSSASNNDKNKSQSLHSVSWLILADHRPKNGRTMASLLTADKLSATVEQQLKTLSIRRLEGVIVQTGSYTTNQPKNNNKAKDDDSSSELLSLTANKLSQSLPTKHYWQAGKPKVATLNQINTNKKAPISTQECISGKKWQSISGELNIQAITGWSEINDSSVWDCSLAINSDKPIRVLQYNAANPLQSPPLNSQTLALPAVPTPGSNKPAQQNKSRLILDTATHQRLWQLWQLMCTVDKTDNYATTWLAHSASSVPTAVLTANQVEQVVSYDSKSLEAGFALSEDSHINPDDNTIK